MQRCQEWLDGGYAEPRRSDFGTCKFCEHIGCFNLVPSSGPSARTTCPPGKCCRREYVCEYDDYQPIEEMRNKAKPASSAKGNKKRGKKQPGAVVKSNDKASGAFVEVHLPPVKVSDVGGVSSAPQLQKVRTRVSGLWKPKEHEEWPWTRYQLVDFLTPTEDKDGYYASTVQIVLSDRTPFVELLDMVNAVTKAELKDAKLVKEHGSQVHAAEMGPKFEVEFFEQ